MDQAVKADTTTVDAVIALKKHHCRWPHGVPGTATFGFCHKDKKVGPYCIEHARLAYPRLVTGHPPAPGARR